MDGSAEISEEEAERLKEERERILRQLAELSDGDDLEDEEVEGANENAHDGLQSNEQQKIGESYEVDVDDRVNERLSPDSVFDSSKVEENQKYADLDEELADEIEQLDEQQQRNGKPCETRTKRVLEEMERFVELPEGWVTLTHNSGMPIYLHKPTRVVTLSRPYKVTTTLRDHVVPIVSIPCLNRKKKLEKDEEKQKKLEENLAKAESTSCSSSVQLATKLIANVHTELVESTEDHENLTADKLNEYCSKLFKFRDIVVTKYNSTQEKFQAKCDRRLDMVLRKAGFDEKYDDVKSRMGNGDILMTAPSGATLIDITPIEPRRQFIKKPYLLNPMGRTSVTILNEFIQRLVKGRIEYVCEDNRNVTCPYKSTAYLSLKPTYIMQLGGFAKEKLTLLNEQADLSGTSAVVDGSKKFPIGKGIGHSKKIARLAAAKDALEKLIPQLYINDDYYCEGSKDSDNKGISSIRGFNEQALKLLDTLKVDSPRIIQICNQFGMIKPFSLLKEAVSRSIRWNGSTLGIQKDVGMGPQMSKVTLSLGDLKESGEANGVKIATQLAAQALLKSMHPELESYGSYLRLYAAVEEKLAKDDAKKQHDQVVRLQNQGNHLQPNHAVLTKLREEMKKVALVYPPRKFLYGLAEKEEGAEFGEKHRHPPEDKQFISIGCQTLADTLQSYGPTNGYNYQGGSRWNSPNYSSNLPTDPHAYRRKRTYNGRDQLPSAKRMDEG